MNNNPHTFHDFIRQILAVVTNVTLYGTDHPQVSRLASQTYASIRSIVETSPDFSLLVIENELIANGVPQENSLFLNRFIQILKSHGIGRIAILKGISQQELKSFINGLATQHSDADGKISSSEHLQLGRVEVRLGTEGTTEGSGGEKNGCHTSLPDMPKEEMVRFIEIYEAIKRRQKLKLTGISDIVSSFVDMFRQEGKPLLVMAALRENDEYTFTHSTNVCILNLAQAISLGIDGQLLNDIGISAMLHDIGKLFIPEEILTKKDKLSDEEFELMKQHPVKGARYLLETPGVPRMAAIAAFEHHAKFNLSGYPKLSSDWRINLSSHLTMLSDFFDALRTRRSYRGPMELDQISGMMQDMMGSELHPSLTRNFLNILSKLSMYHPDQQEGTPQ